MPENQNGSEGRLARIETKLDGFLERVANVERRQQDSDASRQLNWPVVLAGMGILITVVSVGAGLTASYFAGVMAVEKAERVGYENLAALQITQLERAIGENSVRSINNTQKLGEIDRNMNEVETQFRGVADAESGERADSQRLDQIIWKKVFGDELPAKTPYLRGTNR